MAGDPKKSIRKRRGRRLRKAPVVNDPFGLGRETLIAQAGVRDVFTPHQPISEADLLFGRSDEVQKLVEALNTPGQHVLLYGERGVGKSSLANVVAVAGQTALRKKLFTKRCDSSETFETIMIAPLQEVGADLLLNEVTSSSSRGAGLGAPTVGVVARKASEIVATYRSNGKISPSTVAEALQKVDGVLLIDEADAIAQNDDRRRLAELIKHLSDNGANFKIMVVGIAQTADELTAAHPSVQRCLRETKLRRMTDSELKQIVESGSADLELEFDSEVVSAIVQLSAGYPHFTHLLALKCAEEAIVESRKAVRPQHLTDAMRRAVEDAEGTLRRQYEDAVRSRVEMYRYILMAAARFGGEELRSQDLREEIAKISGQEISQGSLNNYFTRLVSEADATILKRTGKGHYRFQDPRMASFIRIANGMI